MEGRGITSLPSTRRSSHVSSFPSISLVSHFRPRIRAVRHLSPHGELSKNSRSLRYLRTTPGHASINSSLLARPRARTIDTAPRARHLSPACIILSSQLRTKSPSHISTSGVQPPEGGIARKTTYDVATSTMNVVLHLSMARYRQTRQGRPWANPR